jgi:hypothetical protein
MHGTCITNYLSQLTKNFMYKGRVNVGLHVYLLYGNNFHNGCAFHQQFATACVTVTKELHEYL